MTFVEQTEAALPADATVFADMCVAGYWLAGHLRVARRRGLHYPMGWGTLGFAPPAAIGAAAARAEPPTVAFVGDGGMLFSLGELSALAEHRAPCTIVVVDDGGYGMLRFGAHTTAANELPPVDFVQAAQAFGISARQCRRCRQRLRQGARRGRRAPANRNCSTCARGCTHPSRPPRSGRSRMTPR